MDTKYHCSKTLELSTKHISYEDSVALAQYAKDTTNPRRGLAAYDTEYGFLLYVVDDDTVPSPVYKGEFLQVPPYAVAPSVAPIMKLARELGCSYIMLDGDNPVYDDLPTYEW